MQSPSSINFLLFDGIWSLIAVPYLIIAPTLFPIAAHVYALLAVEAVTMIFWFAGFIAVAVALPSPSYCNLFTFCKATTAATVFGAFSWWVPSFPSLRPATESTADRCLGSSSPLRPALPSMP
jgi:hypothetical protein